MTTLAMITPNLRDLSCFTGVGSNVIISTDYARTGTYSFKIPYSSQFILLGHAFIPTTLYIKFAYYITTMSLNCIRVRFLDAITNTQASIAVAADGAITGYRGDSTSLGASSAGVVTAEAWHVLECKVVISNTIGEIVVKIDGVTVLNLTGVDTLITFAGLSATKILNASNVVATNLYLDDLVLDNANWPGMGGLHLLVPTGNGSDVAWTGDYSAVDELPPSDSDYISTTAETLTTRESFVFADIPASAANIRRVAVLTRSKLNAVSDGGIKAYLKSGGTNHDGDKVYLNVSYMWATQIWETDPQDSQAWT
jgi:hypothetical protein